MLISDNAVIIGSLPDGSLRKGTMYLLTDGGLVLPENDRKVFSGTTRNITQYNDGMDVIGHDHILVDGCAGKVLRDAKKLLSGDLTKSVQMFCTAKDTLLFMRADRHKIVIGSGIVILGNAVVFASRVIHKVPLYGFAETRP